MEEVIVNNVSENCQESKVCAASINNGHVCAFLQVLGDDQSHLIALYHSMYLNKGELLPMATTRRLSFELCSSNCIHCPTHTLQTLGLHALLFDAYTHYGAQAQTGQEEEIGDKEVRERANVCNKREKGRDSKG